MLSQFTSQTEILVRYSYEKKTIPAITDVNSPLQSACHHRHTINTKYYRLHNTV
jgi:hypothetical protein